MIRYVWWQCHHMHTLHFAHNEQGDVYCPTCQSIYQKRKPVSTKPETPASKAPVSVLASLSLGLLLLGFVFICLGTLIPTLPTLIYFGFFDALAAITFAVLSLREDK